MLIGAKCSDQKYDCCVWSFVHGISRLCGVYMFAINGSADSLIVRSCWKAVKIDVEFEDNECIMKLIV